MPFSLPSSCSCLQQVAHQQAAQSGASSAFPGCLVGLVVYDVICRHMCYPEESPSQGAYAQKPDWQGLKHAGSKLSPARKERSLNTLLATCNVTHGHEV